MRLELEMSHGRWFMILEDDLVRIMEMISSATIHLKAKVQESSMREAIEDLIDEGIIDILDD
ncbi:MAG: hypothetical protein EBS06_09615 [Proteobacteria bacterium]|nr:hypothetical protein [Pseudomonadota bacterium]